MDTANQTTLSRKTEEALDLDKVSVDKKTLIVRRSDKEKEDVVMIPISEYNSWIETDYLLSSEANRAHLRASLQQAEKGDTEKVDWDKLWT